MGVLKLFEGAGELFCAIATIKTSEGVIQKVVDGTVFSVGRAPDCVLSIPDVGISRLHMLVTIKRGEIYINDQGSANGTFLNGERVEPKRLISIKATDEIKLGKSEVVLQFGVLEKHFKTDYVAESLLPQTEKDNLLGLIKSSHHKAQEIVTSAQTQADQIIHTANEKARATENQSLLKQEDVLAKAQVESQGIIAETKRKSAQMIFEAEEKARESVHQIHLDAETQKMQADEYYKATVHQAQKKADEIIAQHTKMGQELIEELRRTTLEKAEREAKEQLAGVYKETLEKSEELKKLQEEIHVYQTTKRSEIDAEHDRIRKEFETKINSDRQAAADEHHSKLAMLEAEHLKKKKELAENEKQRAREIETKSRELNQKLDADFDLKLTNLEKDYADKAEQAENEYLAKTKELEEDFQKRQADLTKKFEDRRDELTADYESRNANLKADFEARTTKLTTDYERLNAELATNYDTKKSELDNTLAKQKEMLEKEVETQRQELVKVQAEIQTFSETHRKLKTELDELKQTVKGLHKTEQDAISSIQEKRKEIENLTAEYQAQTNEVSTIETKISELKAAQVKLVSDYEEEQKKYQELQQQGLQKHQAAIMELQKNYDADQLKYKEETEALRNQYQTELDAMKTKFEAETQRVKREADSEIQKTRADIVQKTQSYQELEQIKLEEYKTQLLNEKKQMEMKFESTKKEFELKTREMIDFEKKKLEENKQQFLSMLNQQRAFVINDLTKAILKLEKRGDPSQSSQLITQAVETVFDSHVAELSVTTQTSTAPASVMSLKAQWLSYGVGITLALVVGFKMLIQPQINRHVAGTEENAAAMAVSKERPKYQRTPTAELKDTYVDSVVYTQRYAEIYLDEELHDKWFKYISSYMFENWRVPEEKTIEAVAIAKSLVDALEKTAVSLDQEFANQGIEKMRVTEEEAIKRISDALGTQVKYEAFKRKEKEFFEPYIVNQ